MKFDESDLIRLATQLPVSELGHQFLHLKPGSKTSLYLLELSKIPTDPMEVEDAEDHLSRPLEWMLCQLHNSNSEMSLEKFDVTLRNAFTEPVFIELLNAPQPARLYAGLRAFLALAVKSGFITLDTNRVMLSLMGNKQLRHPAPMLPIIARALHDGDKDAMFIRLIVGAMVQVFSSASWAPQQPFTELAAELLNEMGHETSADSLHDATKTFDDLIYPAGCDSSEDKTAMVLLQYLVSEALQPE